MKNPDFRKNRISRSGSGLGGTGTSGEWPWGPKGSIEAKKAKKISGENPDFPDPDPEIRISAYGIEIGAERATCGQNFRPLAAVVTEIITLKTIIIY